MTTTSEFDRDTAVWHLGDGRYRAELSADWNVGAVPNGGYVAAVAAAAVRDALPFPDLLTLTTHFLRPATPGHATIEIETVKQGRNLGTAAGRLVQGGAEVLRLLATVGRLDPAMDGPLHVDGAPPPLPPPEETPSRVAQADAAAAAGKGDAAVPAEPEVMPITRRFDMRLAPQHTGFMRGERASQAEVSGWLRFADGRAADVWSLQLIADAFPPAVFQILDPGWVPTIELTVQVRARPAAGWLRCRFRTRFVQNGLLEEDGEIWDASDNLVALSRQLAAMPRVPVGAPRQALARGRT